MENYVFNANDVKHYQNVMSGGGDLDGYIFNAQDGNGIGSFFGPILKAIVPVAKTIGSALFGIAKPAARAAAQEGIKGMSSMALNSLANKTVETVQRSRKRKSLKKSRSSKRVR